MDISKGLVLWFTGLSGAGKTTIAIALRNELKKRKIQTKILDGDNLRKGLCKDLGFSLADRKENIRRVAEVSKLFSEEGILTVVSFISPTNELRNLAKDIIGEEYFMGIYINTPIEECEKRDVKGMYAKARNGEIRNFTGIDQIFEPPTHTFFEIITLKTTIDQSVQLILEKILPKLN